MVRVVRRLDASCGKEGDGESRSRSKRSRPAGGGRLSSIAVQRVPDQGGCACVARVEERRALEGDPATTPRGSRLLAHTLERTRRQLLLLRSYRPSRRCATRTDRVVVLRPSALDFFPASTPHSTLAVDATPTHCDATVPSSAGQGHSLDSGHGEVGRSADAVRVGEAATVSGLTVRSCGREQGGSRGSRTAKET